MLASIEKWAEAPFYPTLTTVLAVITGALGSVFSAEIAGAFPFCCWVPSWTWSFEYSAIGFWSALFVLAYLFFVREKVKDRTWRHFQNSSVLVSKSVNQIQKDTEAIQGGAEAMRQQLQTLPPQAFRTKFSTLCQATSNVLQKHLPRTPKDGIDPSESLQAAISDLLAAIATLSLVYDGHPSVGGEPARYAANVMTFIPRQTNKPHFPDGIEGLLKFTPIEYGEQHLKGALLLREELSYSTESEKSEIDSKIGPLAFPVPINDRYKQLWRVLPGAPMAFVTRSIQGHSDTDTLVTWCEKNGDFSKPVLDELQQYLQQTRKYLRSFVSWPLVNTKDEPFAVLNIHSNMTEILGPGGERKEVFSAMISPFVFELTNAVKLMWLFRVFSGCPVDPCAIMQFLWDRYRPLRSSLAADRAPASHKSLITFMLA